MSLRKYNLKRDPAHHEVKYKYTVHHNSVLPSNIDLRTSGNMPCILDQGSLGSCASNAASNIMRYLLNKSGSASWQPSRLFIYFYTRALENSPIDEDTGVSIYGTLHTIKLLGACNELFWPYDISQFSKYPSSLAFSEASMHKIRYVSLNQDLNSIKHSLADGYPVICGIQIYSGIESEMTSRTGRINLPTSADDLLGGHAISLYGYDDVSQEFLVMNSWGTEVGDKGWFKIPYRYILDRNLTADLWSIQSFY